MTGRCVVANLVPGPSQKFPSRTVLYAHSEFHMARSTTLKGRVAYQTVIWPSQQPHGCLQGEVSLLINRLARFVQLEGNEGSMGRNKSKGAPSLMGPHSAMYALPYTACRFLIRYCARNTLVIWGQRKDMPMEA